ncbi:MAG: hypothetical protein U1B79_00930 [Candidatus Pacearchaeota archaeon]|nr:hypothetical protein [Nanoarchaeota archaeon]MDZ4226654.1 hypothetical protein [Candidatus Pacearchaeota archaeon]
MGLEKTLAIEKEKLGFYAASCAYMLTGLADGLLTVKGLNLGIASDWNPLAQLLVDYYGAGSGVAILKLNSLMAIMASEIVERRATSNFQKSITHKFLYAGAALSGVGIMGWLNA